MFRQEVGRDPKGRQAAKRGHRAGARRQRPVRHTPSCRALLWPPERQEATFPRPLLRGRIALRLLTSPTGVRPCCHAEWHPSTGNGQGASSVTGRGHCGGGRPRCSLVRRHGPGADQCGPPLGGRCRPGAGRDADLDPGDGGAHRRARGRDVVRGQRVSVPSRSLGWRWISCAPAATAARAASASSAGETGKWGWPARVLAPFGQT